jgi:hypothetical protein
MHPLSQFNYCPKCGSTRFVENNFKSKKCEACNFVYYFNSCGSTVAFILNDKSELLVATRAHEPAIGTLDLPGGFIDMNETAEEAVGREVKEETGLDVTGVKYLFSYPISICFQDLKCIRLTCFLHAKQMIFPHWKRMTTLPSWNLLKFGTSGLNFSVWIPLEKE